MIPLYAVNPLLNGNTLDGNIGNASDGTQRVVIASDDVNLASMNTNIQNLVNASPTVTIIYDKLNTVNTNKFDSVISNATISGGFQLDLTTLSNPAVASYASKRRVNVQIGVTYTLIFSAIFSTGGSGIFSFVGIGNNIPANSTDTIDDGFGFFVDITTLTDEISVMYSNNGVLTKVYNGSFSGSFPSGFVSTNINNYRIDFYGSTNNNVNFYILDSTSNWHLVHTFTLINSNPGNIFDEENNFRFITYLQQNDTVSQSISLFGIHFYKDKDLKQLTPNLVYSNLTQVSNTELYMFSIFNDNIDFPTAGSNSGYNMLLKKITLYVTGSNIPYKLYISNSSQSTITGTSYSQIKSFQPAQHDTAGSLSSRTGSISEIEFLSQTSSICNLEDSEIILYPNDTFIFTAIRTNGSGNQQVQVTVEFEYI